MKHFLLCVGMLLMSGITLSQTDQLNQQKYWKLRDALREDFVKISNEPGGSIVARALKPNYCFNNTNSNSPGYGGFTMGEMHSGNIPVRLYPS